MNFIENIDQELFFFINNNLHFGFFNDLMPYWRSMWFWLPLYVFLVGFIVLNFKKNALVFILILISTVAISDSFSSQIIKKNVQRIRPCNVESLKGKVKLLVHCGSGYSFTSSHATNHFTVANFLIFTIFQRKKWVKWSLIFWAFSIAFGQVYVGVHYPLDVVGGGILGSVIGYFAAFIYRKYFNEKMIVL